MLASTARVANHPLLDHWEEAWATKDRGADTGKEPSHFTQKRDLNPCRAADPLSSGRQAGGTVNRPPTDPSPPGRGWSKTGRGAPRGQ
jgi:hypothetical protein